MMMMMMVVVRCSWSGYGVQKGAGSGEMYIDEGAGSAETETEDSSRIFNPRLFHVMLLDGGSGAHASALSLLFLTKPSIFSEANVRLGTPSMHKKEFAKSVFEC